uniref:Uncharacterized protein n=1 Tax=Arundo donax TaxID=35708 RepID=A0A0A9BV98_ARUDO
MTRSLSTVSPVEYELFCMFRNPDANQGPHK